MNRIIAATAITFVAAVAHAHDVYGPLGQDNPEVFDEHRTIGTPTMQTGMDSTAYIFGELAPGNPELYPWGGQARSPVTEGEPGPDIYQNLCNPTLAC
ncbi:hypothetical protein [Thiocapsa roseopersicina]|uniref:Uncharacterized protein n=1 Tax=Thiocapsa roseopersicina TaxID=1058 RepID=A0A1H2W838_THIRO|nr:hypothetical protein [Thiocapsa roseopersicina]SDW76740.1 hypothetical protein SAMN05421783_10886 [Thiocapsa roseopersicina]